MDKRKRNIIILVILCLLLVVIGVFVCVDIFSKNDTDNLLINNKDDSVISEENTNDETIENIDINNAANDKENVYVNDEVEDNIDTTLDTDITNNNQDNYSEEDVVSYFENIEKEVETSTSFKEKFKEYFIITVDFIFYGGEIKGYTFSELTGTAKAKIIAVALKIDNKIEEYIPGYKESISSVTGKVYTDIKEKLVSSYMDISSTICKDNIEECNKVKDIFSDVKDYCKIGWDFIKGLFKSGATKIKDWYEIYSGK